MLDIKGMLYSNLQTMTVEEYQKYVNEADLGFIKINKHQEDENIVILNYTEMATFEKRWNKQTMSARGLILDLTDAKDNGKIYILAKPFDKFPNYGSNEIEGYEDDIDWNEVESIMEKMDGSLGISYFFKEGIRFATRGSFHSEQAERATEIWRKKYSQFVDKFDEGVYIHYPYTLLVEIIYPENRVVVNYNGMEDLVLLGAIDICNHPYEHPDWTYRMLKDYAYDLDMPIAPQYKHSLEELLELKKQLSANEEGFIVRFKNGKRLKIKGDEYLHVHRLLHGVSEKAKFKAWATGEMTEYIKQLPEEFRPELEEFAENLDKLKDSIYTLLQAIFEMINEKSSGRKDFALTVNDVVAKEYRKFMFDARQKGSISVDLIRKHIADNYIEYSEVISAWNNQDS